MTDWPSAERPPADPGSDNRVRLGFERQSVTVSIDQIVPLKTLREGVRESRKYAQIVSSIKAIGLVEAPAVVPNPKNSEQYFLLDGHLRIEVLKQLGIERVECLVANDDETYTYNKRVNRLPPIQEHRMIVRAIERGVTEAVIADALGLEVGSIRARFRLLDGICEETADMLKDTNCSMRVFDMLRRMSPMRQIEAADLMIGQNNYSLIFARALLAATPEDQLAAPAKKTRKNDLTGPTSQQISRMERELATLQTQVKSVEDSYGIDNLHLTFARGYVAKLLSNARVVRWLSNHRQEYLSEFQRIAEIESIGTVATPTPQE
ncbi:MAG: ParB N-terminal domain-containing protein [Sphingomonas sp.]|nr:ParB N-terminal domain-containing protein [Sphingomonas sp.]